tara:strand:- start:1155 stop:1337 length:183 start_codon:yes stop_codon:yes gene_type:complete
MLKKYKIEYFDVIEATDEEQAKEFLLSHLSTDVEHGDVTCFEITEIKEKSSRHILHIRKF